MQCGVTVRKGIPGPNYSRSRSNRHENREKLWNYNQDIRCMGRGYAGKRRSIMKRYAIVAARIRAAGHEMNVVSTASESN
jgi:hypothetical protein